MALLRLAFLSVVLACVSSSPIAPHEPSRETTLDGQNIRPVVLSGTETVDRVVLDHGRPITPTPAIPSATPLSVSLGEAMKPILGRREALNLDSGHLLSPMDTAMVPAKGCTTTLSETYSCTWDGTQTIYPSTTTLYRQVNCNGCDSIDVRKDIYYCPNQIISATARVGAPSTSWSTTCLPSAVLRQRAESTASATTTNPGPGPALTVASTPRPTIPSFPTPSTQPRDKGA
jgi:hypothetical protein